MAFDPIQKCEQREVMEIRLFPSRGIDNAFVPIVILDEQKGDGFDVVKSGITVGLGPHITKKNPLPIETVSVDGEKNEIALKFKIEKGNPAANDRKGDITVIGNRVKIKKKNDSQYEEETVLEGIQYGSSFELMVSVSDIGKDVTITFLANDDDLYFDGGIEDVLCGKINIEGATAAKGFYYGIDGTLLGRIGTETDPTDVMLINDISKKEDIEKWEMVINAINEDRGNELELMKVSSKVGMKNEELNMRAFLTVVRIAENSSMILISDNRPMDYNVNYGGGTFSSYDKHPNKSVTRWGATSNAAGAYQIRIESWNLINRIEKQPDFSPTSQDKGAVILINEQEKWNPRAKGVIYDIETGNVESAVVKLNRTWTSLPEGPEKKINREDAKRIFKECISKELTDKSSIAIPKGELIL